MAISNFVPEVWAAELLVALEKNLVYAAPGVVNRDYEGEIAQYGDTVHITTLGDPTIGTYTPHSDITIEDVDDTPTTLTIDQAKYFAFEVDDIERRQARDG
ncbi:MAG: coat protein, partial [Acidimicrobiia bacterium]